MSQSSKLVGISAESIRFGFAGFGMSGLWQCAFSGHDYSWNKGHQTRMAAFLLGGWKDDLTFEKIKHLQRIFLDEIPSLDTARVSVERIFPLETKAELDIKGFVKSSGDFYSPYPIRLGCDSGISEIKYRQYGNQDINIASHCESEDTRKEKFDLVCGVWLADGRIFAENDSVVGPLLRLGILAASRVHNGMWWNTIEKAKKE